MAYDSDEGHFHVPLSRGTVSSRDQGVLATILIGRHSRAASRFQAEEQVAIPAGSCNRAGDGGEAAVGVPVPLETILEDGDFVRGALPFSNEPRAGLDRRLLSNTRDPACGFQFGGESLQALARARIEAAECLFLNCIGDRSNKKLAAELPRWLGAPKGAPALFQGGVIEVGQRRDSLLDVYITRLAHCFGSIQCNALTAMTGIFRSMPWRIRLARCGSAAPRVCRLRRPEAA